MSRDLDVAIVGPGTVGLYLASVLPAGLAVALVGDALDPDSLLGVAPATSGHGGVLTGWAGGYGGTSTLWGGQLWPWQPWEIAGGAGRPGWPLDYATDLAPHYAAVLTRLGLDAAQRTDIHERSGTTLWPDLRTELTEVRYSTWMDRRHRDFRRNPAIQPGLVGVERIPVNVSRVQPRNGGRSALLAADGTEIAIANRVVLTAGTLGNIRLLQDHAAQTGSTRPVGHGFGDHLSARAAAVQVVDRARFTAFTSPRFIPHGRMTTRLATTAAHSERSGAMPAYAHFEVASPALAAVRDLAASGRSGLPRAARRLAGQSPHLPRQLAAAAGALARGRRPVDPAGDVFLRIDLEQPLRHTSFARWVDGRLQLDWVIGEEERVSAAAAAALVTPLAEQYLGVRLEPLDELELHDIYHLIGGTRMGSADDPAAVVDADLRLIDGDGVWVVGASTYPSGGMANPTFTALALADRAAARLA